MKRFTLLAILAALAGVHQRPAIETVQPSQQSQEPPKSPPLFKIDMTFCCGSIKHATSDYGERYITPAGEYGYYDRVDFDTASNAIKYEEKTICTADEVIEQDGKDARGKHENEERILIRAPKSAPATARFWIIKRKGPVYVQLRSGSVDLVRVLEKQLFDTDSGPLHTNTRDGQIARVKPRCSQSLYDAEKSKESQEESIFGMEGPPLSKPVEVPDGILQILRTDTNVQNHLNEGQTPADIPASWFEGSQIHLDGSDELDLVVIPKNGLLFGANVGPIWVFHKTPKGYDEVLSISVHDLEVLKTKWKGFREIKVYSMTAVTITTETFRFDGQRYTSFNKITKPIN